MHARKTMDPAKAEWRPSYFLSQGKVQLRAAEKALRSLLGCFGILRWLVVTGDSGEFPEQSSDHQDKHNHTVCLEMWGSCSQKPGRGGKE
ncbi:hypothetical protein JOQ06_006318, partial [Pogonophryne albipinna]